MLSSIRFKWAMMFAFLVLALAVSTDVLAFTAPAANSFAYDVYDTVVNQILKGPIGFAAGVMCILVAIVSLVQGRIMLAIPAIIAAVLLIKADTIVTSMGVVF